MDTRTVYQTKKPQPASAAGANALVPNALTLDKVIKSFVTRHERRFRAVDELSLTINRGEIVAFLGPNGAGKTTALDMVLGLTKPDSGTIRVLERTPADAINEGRVAAVLQTGALLGDLSVSETVRMIAALYPCTIGVDEAMRRAGIEKFAARKVSKCSGGEQQRLRFALALLPDPDLLVLDEPTAGMDVNARQAFWQTMREEARSGRTIIFATHYLQEAEDFAERILLIDRGKLIADGTVDEIRSLAGTKTVTARYPDVSIDELNRLRGVTRARRINDVRIELQTSDSDGLARYLLNETHATNLEIRTASLDTAFTELTTNNGTPTTAEKDES